MQRLDRRQCGEFLSGLQTKTACLGSITVVLVTVVCVLLQCGKVQQAIDMCVHLNQWNTAIDLARGHNIQGTEPLLVKYAETLLHDNKTFSAIELYRKADHLVDAAKLLFQVSTVML